MLPRARAAYAPLSQDGRGGMAASIQPKVGKAAPRGRGVVQRVVDEKMVSAMEQASVGFAKADLIFTVKAPESVKTTAGVIFLEKGNAAAGLTHMMKHIDEFVALGVAKAGFAGWLETLVAGAPTSVEPGKNGGTNAHYVVHGQTTFTVTVVIGANGFIVTAHPYETTAAEYYKTISKDPATFIRLGGLAAYSSQ
jgi:hypothetical protein